MVGSASAVLAAVKHARQTLFDPAGLDHEQPVRSIVRRRGGHHDHAQRNAMGLGSTYGYGMSNAGIGQALMGLGALGGIWRQ